MKLSCVNLTSHLLLSLQLNGFAWSAGILVDCFSEQRHTLDLFPLGTGTGGGGGRALVPMSVGLSLSMTVAVDMHRTAQIKIFSRFALIDRTGLDLSVRTRRQSKKGGSGGGDNESDFFKQYSTVERHTYAKKRPLPHLSSMRDATRGGGRDGSVLSERRTERDTDTDCREYFPSDWDDGGWGDLNADVDVSHSKLDPSRNTGHVPFMSRQSEQAGAVWGRSDGEGGHHDGDRDGGSDGDAGRGGDAGLAGECWSHGAHGLCIFHSDPQDNKFSVGINKGAVWSEPKSLLALGASKVPFELIDKTAKCAYQLAHKTTQLPGVFKATQLVSIMPCFCVVNCLSEFIELRQVGPLSTGPSGGEGGELTNLFFPTAPIDLSPSRKKCMVEAQSCIGWHRYDITKGTSVQFRCESSAWSIGTVNLNEIGSTELLVPRKRSAPSFYPKGNENGNGDSPLHLQTRYAADARIGVDDGVEVEEEAMVLHVEVRFSDPSDHSYVNIVLWAPTPDQAGHCHRSSLSIRNDTQYPITVTQVGTDVIASKCKADPARFTVRISPGMWKPFGWADRSHGSKVWVTVDPPAVRDGREHMAGMQPSFRDRERERGGDRGRDRTVGCEIDILKIGQSAKIFLSSDGRDERNGEDGMGMGGGEVISLDVLAGAGGQILHLSMRQGVASRRSISISSSSMDDSANTHTRSHKRDKDKDKDKEALLITSPYLNAQRDFTLLLNLKSVGVSLIAERPVRREFLSLYLDGIDARMVQKLYPKGVPSRGGMGSTGGGGGEGAHPINRLPSVITSYALQVADMQVDNYSETAIFPVLVHSFSASHRERKKAARRRKRAIRKIGISHRGRGRGRSSGRGVGAGSGRGSAAGKEGDGEEGVDDIPFFAMCIVQEQTQGSAAPIFKYVAVRLLEVKVAVDSSTLLLYFCDLHGDLGGETREQALASDLPQQWLEDFNHSMVSPGYSRVYGDMGDDDAGQLVDIAKTAKTAQEGKMYFEALIIHPIKLRLSFLPTPFPRSRHEDILSGEEFRGFKLVTAIAQVDDLVVKISCFHTEETMESGATLGSRIVANVLRDLQNHLVAIVGRVFGSLEFIGKPAGLYRNVGEGVKQFFYEVKYCRATACTCVLYCPVPSIPLYIDLFMSM